MTVAKVLWRFKYGQGRSRGRGYRRSDTREIACLEVKDILCDEEDRNGTSVNAVDVRHMIAKRYLSALELKHKGAASYRFTWSLVGGAWVYDRDDTVIDWYPWAIIRLLTLKDESPKW